MTRTPCQSLARVRIIAFLAAALCTQVAAQEDSTSSPRQDDTDATGADTNPTKPVLVSFRNEYFDLGRNR